MNKIRQFFKTFIKIFYISSRRLYEKDYSYQASALSFITVLSIVPIVSVILYILSFFSIFNEFLIFAENYIYLNFVPESALAIKDYLHQFAAQADHLPFISMIFFFITGTLMLMTIEKAFNNTCEVTIKPRKLIWKLITWTLALLIIFLVGLISFISESLLSLFLYHQLHTITLQALNLVVNSLLLATLYVYIPSHTLTWRKGLFGGFIVAFLFEIIKHLFSFYIIYLANYKDIYGGLAVIPIFLVWIYISWMIVLFGAILICEKENFLLSLKH